MSTPTVAVTPSDSNSHPRRYTLPPPNASQEDLRAEISFLHKELQRLQALVDSNSSTATDVPHANTRRSSSPSQGISRIPVASVSLNRALVDLDPPSPSSKNNSIDRSPSPSQQHLDVSGGNPFFGGNSGRNRVIQGQISSQSGTGKVITSLQQDLASVRSVLESTRGQLRLSQKAVEHLTRTSEDLKDGKERLRLENEGLSKMVSRKERMLAESLEHHRKAETSLANLKEIYKRDSADTKAKIRDMESRAEDAEGYRKKCDSEYQAMKSSVHGLMQGWKLEMEQVRKQMKQLEEKHKKEIEDTKLKHNTLAKMYKARTEEQSSFSGTIDSLRKSREQFSKEYTEVLSKLRIEAEENLKKTEESQTQVEEVHNELKRLLRLIRAGDRL